MPIGDETGPEASADPLVGVYRSCGLWLQDPGIPRVGGGPLVDGPEPSEPWALCCQLVNSAWF